MSAISIYQTSYKNETNYKPNITHTYIYIMCSNTRNV